MKSPARSLYSPQASMHFVPQKEVSSKYGRISRASTLVTTVVNQVSVNFPYPQPDQRLHKVPGATTCCENCPKLESLLSLSATKAMKNGFPSWDVAFNSKFECHPRMHSLLLVLKRRLSSTYFLVSSAPFTRRSSLLRLLATSFLLSSKHTQRVLPPHPKHKSQCNSTPWPPSLLPAVSVGRNTWISGSY